MRGLTRGSVVATALLLAFSYAAPAAAKPKEAAQPSSTSSPIQILPGTGSKEPITIDADKLVYFDKEKKAIYSGSVVVVQGDTKMTCSTMTVYLEQSPEGKGADGKTAEVKTAEADPSEPKAASDATQGPSQNSGIRRLEAAGPVTVVSKTQVATGDSGLYDKEHDKVYLIGHVTLSDGPNVTKGDKLTYDLKSGQAIVETSGGKAGRVHGQFTPNSGNEPGGATPATPAKPKSK